MKGNEWPRVVLVNRSFVINKKGKILLLKRSKKERVGAEMWEVPGGKLDEGQDICHALEREVFEETGLLVTPLLRTGYFESEVIASGPYTGLPYIVIIGISRADNEVVKISGEHDSFEWVKLADLDRYELRLEIKKAAIVLRKNLLKIIRSLK